MGGVLPGNLERSRRADSALATMVSLYKNADQPIHCCCGTKGRTISYTREYFLHLSSSGMCLLHVGNFSSIQRSAANKIINKGLSFNKLAEFDTEQYYENYCSGIKKNQVKMNCSKTMIIRKTRKINDTLKEKNSCIQFSDVLLRTRLLIGDTCWDGWLVEASWSHFEAKFLTVTTKICSCKVLQRQLFHSLCVNLKDGGIR